MHFKNRKNRKVYDKPICKCLHERRNINGRFYKAYS